MAVTMLPVESRPAVSFCTKLLGAGTQQKSDQQTSAEVVLALLSCVGRWRT